MGAARGWGLSSDDTETLSHYIREMSKFPRLTPEEEKELGRRIRQGDEKALRKLVECNLRFCVSYAKRFRGLGLSFLDLIHEGNLGLIQAARRFDPDRNVKFISYAVWWIRQSIIQAVSEHTRVFSVPSRMAAAFSRIEREFKADKDDKGTPAPEEVAATLDLSLDAVNTFIAISGNERLFIGNGGRGRRPRVERPGDRYPAPSGRGETDSEIFPRTDPRTSDRARSQRGGSRSASFRPGRRGAEDPSGNWGSATSFAGTGSADRIEGDC